MPSIPFRGLGTRGIVKDLPATDIPLEAYTGGNNVRFSNGSSMRAPSWRSSNTGLAFVPSGAFRYAPPNGDEITFIPAETGRIWSRNSGGTLTDVSVSGHVNSTSNDQFTGCSLGGVAYLNRPTHVPAFYGPASSLFATIPAWTSTHRCAVLRSYKDFLVAFNVTKGAALFPTMVKWSDAALAGAPPASWDETDPTKLAGETILAEIEGPILDAQNLRDAMIIYAQREVWAMEFVGGQFIFKFRRLFNDGGIINVNCALEIAGKHYVFGTDDLYVHDGVNRQSLAEGRIRDFVFRNINLGASRRCFVAHNVVSKEILFAYVSGDADAFPGFTGGLGCNRAVVYCYANDTWGIMDLPNVFGPMALAPSGQSLTYATVSSDYLGIGGSYQDVGGGSRLLPIATVRATGASSVPSDRLSLLDAIQTGSLSTFPLDTALLTPAYLEKEHIDLDETGAPLTMFKTVNEVTPQMRVSAAIPVEFTFGANDIHGISPVWDPPITYDPRTDYRVDTRLSGRYLAMRLTVASAMDFSLSGLDANVLPNGNR
jgi:hypothetical protein